MGEGLKRAFNAARATRKNPAAVALGKLAKGKPKSYGPEELARRAERINKARIAYQSKLPEARKTEPVPA